MTNNQAIPAEAVEAAAKVLYRKIGTSWEDAQGRTRDLCRRDALVALEAAAPHILADAWDAAIDAHKAWTWDDENIDPLTNPYRSTP